MVKKKSGKQGELNSVNNSSDENDKNESPHLNRERSKSRLRRHRSSGGGENGDPTNVASREDSAADAKKTQKRQRKKRRKRKSSRANTTTGSTESSSEWSAVDKRSGSRIPSRQKKKEDKPKDLSEKDLVEWMQKMVPYVTTDSPLWNKWTLAPLYHFIRNPNAVLCIAFLTSSKSEVLQRLQKICQGSLITFNQIIPEYSGEFFYFLKIEQVPLDGLNYDEIVFYGNIPSEDHLKTLNNLLVNYWTPILMDEECLPIGIKNDVFTELNTISCATQTATHFVSSSTQNELLLYIPPEIGRQIDGKNDFEMAKDKEFGSRLEETIVYWITKLKQILILHDHLNDTDTWPGPLEEIQFWTDRGKNLKNILNQIHTVSMRRILRILAICHSPYFSELRSIFEQVGSFCQEASSNALYLEPLRQPLEKLKSCKLKEVCVEMQKFLWLALTIWRNAPYYNSSEKLNGLVRKFSNALIIHCKSKISVKKIFQGVNIQKAEKMLQNCLKYLEWWREIYKLTEEMYKSKAENGRKLWIFEKDQIFVHVDALVLRMEEILEICKVQKLYKVESLPLYPGVKGPYIAGVMKSCDRILSDKLEELVKVSQVVLDVKSTEWNEHMKGFRDTVLAIDMSVQNVLELSFEQMPNLKRKIELMQLFQRFYEKRDIVTRQLDKLCVKLYEHFEEEVLRLKKMFEKKIVPLPGTYTKIAGKGTWAIFMKNRIESDLDILKKAETWLPKTSGVGFQNLVKNEAKSLAEAMGAYTEKCYKTWAKDFQHVESRAYGENHREKLEVPLLIRRGKGQLVKVNFDRGVYTNLSEAEMWVRVGRSVPPVLLLTIYPWREKLHDLKENAWVVAKWYNKCVGGLSRDERLLFKDRLLSVEKKIYPCLAHGEFTWTSVKTADHGFLEEFRCLVENVLDNVKEYREATCKVVGIIERICERRLVKVYTGVGGKRGKGGKIYEGIDEFKMMQNGRIEKELRRIVKGYREIARILREMFTKLFRGDGVEVKVQWGKYVNLVDFCLEEALKLSVRKSLEILDEAVGKDQGDRPFFEVKMLLDGGELRFEPKLEEMAGMILGVHKNLGKTVEPLMRLGKFLGTGKVEITWKKDGGLKGYCDALLEDENSLEIQKRLKFAIERCLSEVNLYSERWIPYRDIWEVDREEFMVNYEKQYPHIEAYERDLKKYREISEIVLGGDSMVTIRWLQLDCSKLIEGIAGESTEWFMVLAGTLYKKGKESLTTVYNYMEENRRALCKEPETLKEQLDTWKIAQNVRGEVKQKIFSSFPGIREKFGLLRKYDFEIEPEVEEMELNLEKSWRKYLRFLRETDEKLEKSRGRLKQAFLDQADILKGKVDELLRIWDVNGPFSRQNGEFKSDEAFMQLENFRNEVKALQQEDVELIGSLETFNIKKGESKRLKDMEGDIGYLGQVWKVVKGWEGHWSKWEHLRIFILDVDKINIFCENFVEIFREFNKQFEIKSWPLICEMIDSIENVQTCLKCCLFLRQHTLQDRHWEWIKNLVLQRGSPNADQFLQSRPENLDLKIIIQLEMYKFLGPISEMSWSSEKEMAVEKTLRKIEDFWENEAFILIKRNVPTQKAQILFEIQCSPGLENNLMDHLVSLTAMKGSRFIGISLESVDFWERSLQNVSDVLGEILETQESWLKLDQLFCKEHIQRVMPSTARSFNVVSSVWASVLLIVTQVRYVFRVINETDKLLEMLKDLQWKMEDVQGKLGVYLQEIRQEFPRFYFVPDEELLGCLAGEDGNMNDDFLEVLRKIFGNFGGICERKNEGEIGGDLVVEGVVSRDGDEELGLGNPVKICEGPLEAWAADLEMEIRSSVKENLRDCLKMLGGNWSKMDEWVLGTDQWTEQSLLTAIKIQWTADVTKAIRQKCEDENGEYEGSEGRSGDISLKRVIKRLKRSIGKFGDILGKMEMEMGQVKILEAVVITLSYLKDVTERLHGRNCNDLESFEWLQYLRWYWVNGGGGGGHLVARQGFAVVAYGWEYCDGGMATVITPLTERSFLALTTAVGFGMGAVVHGNWNCGKKETLNDLGGQFGKLVMNLRVNKHTEYWSLSQFIIGIVGTGAWGVLRNVDNCEPENVQNIVCKLGLITRAKAGNHGKIMLDGKEIRLDRGCGIFALISNGEKNIDNSLLTSLKSVMRPVAMIQPDYKNILEIKLFLGRFENFIGLAKKIETIFVNLRNHLKKFAIFSLVTMLVCVKRAVELKGYHGKRINENEAVIKALENVVLPGLVDEKERKLFLNLLKSHFPQEIEPPSLKGEMFNLEYFIEKAFKQLEYQFSEKILQNCLQLYELMKIHRAVVIVGKTGSGKSVVRKILKTALTLMHYQRGLSGDVDILEIEYVEDEVRRNDTFIKEYIINPATMNGTLELFGGDSKNVEGSMNNKWKDGIVTKMLKNFHKNRSENDLLWLVFDGPLEKCWVSEEIQDLCSEKSRISLTNCDTVAVPKQLTTYFETDSLKNVSPGLLAKCGLLFIKDANEKEEESVWKLSLTVWLKKLSNCILKRELEDYLPTVLEKCSSFRFEQCSSLIQNLETLQLVEMFMELLDSYFKGNEIKKFEKMEKSRFILAIKQITAFSIVWSVFIGLDEENQQKTSVFLKDLHPFQNIYPAKRTVFDYFLDIGNQKWMKWDNNLQVNSFPINASTSMKDVVETVDVSKVMFLMKQYGSWETENCQVPRPVLFCGPHNSGKSRVVMSALRKNKTKMIHIQMTPHTTARSLQSLIKTRLESVSTVCLSPSSGKPLTIFVDDINVNRIGGKTSPSGEFLRYLMEYCMWFDGNSGDPMAISNVEFVATMATNHSEISPRLQRRFSMIYLPNPDEFQLRKIFTRKIMQKLDNFVPAVKLLADGITVATLEIYKLISTENSDSLNNCHPFHCFSLHDISRVYEGLFRAQKESQDTKHGFLRLWFYECTRVFCDRLVDKESRCVIQDILEKQVMKHFEINTTTLFPPVSNKAIKEINIFGNFMKGSKCYEEIKNVNSVYKYFGEKLNEIVKEKPVVLFKERILKIVKISRVLSQEKGHLIICGERGEGRETATRAASLLYNFKIFKTSNEKWFLKNLKEAFYTSVVEDVGCCVILKVDQITKETLEWVNIIASSVEISELFSKKEVTEIFKTCQKTNDKFKNDDNVDVMTWFKEKVEKNLHIVLCIELNHKEFFRNLSGNYSQLLKNMTINWFDIWTQASYIEIAKNLLKSEQDSYEIFYKIHSIPFQESKAISPMQFVDFIEIYKWYLNKGKEEYSRKMKMFKNAIQEIGNVRSKIGMLTEQAQLAEKKAEESRQECERMLKIIKEQESEQNAQEVIVQEKNGMLEEEIKEYEELAKIIKEEWSGALGDFEKETEVVQDLGEEDLQHIRSYFSPPPLVSRVLDAVMIMLEKEESWPEAKIQLGHPGFIKSILEYDKARITMEKLNNLRKFIQNKEFTPEAVSKYSNGARILCAWIHAIEKYGKCYLNKICPKREKLESAEQSILENKHVLLLASEKLDILRENLTEIETIYETKVQLKESLEEEARQCGDVLGRATSVLSLLEDEGDGCHGNHVLKWKENLVKIDNKIRGLEGNALLCSAYLAYAGLFSGERRKYLKGKWIQEIENWLGVKIGNEWKLEVALDFEKNLDAREEIQVCLKGTYSWKNEDNREVEWLIENILIVKKSRRDVICLDPHCVQIQNKDTNGVQIVEGISIKRELIENYGRKDENKEKEIFVVKDMSPEEIDRNVTSRFNVVNYALGTQGLTNYFALKIAKMICPEEYSRRQSLIHSAMAEKNRIDSFDEKIPKFVISCGGSSILNNGNFPETLSTWQDQVQESERNLSEMEKEIEEIESKWHRYLYAASSFTKLFEAINEMSKICKFYEISLEFFTCLIQKMFSDEFNEYLEKSSEDPEMGSNFPRKDILEKMLEFFEENISLKLFEIGARSMLKHHRYQFSLLLCLKTLMVESSLIERKKELEEEISLLLSVDLTEEDNCTDKENWLNTKQLESVERLNKLKGYRGLQDSILKSETSLWKEWVATCSTEQKDGKLPVDKWNSKLTNFKKLVVVSILRPDCIPNQILLLAVEVLGEEYSKCLESSRLLDVKNIYDDGQLSPLSISPIMFLKDVNSDGTPDPQPSVFALANSLKPIQKLYTLSISKKNVNLANKLIEEGKLKGFWVYLNLTNCHGIEQWSWELLEILKKGTSQFQRKFKLWICTKLDCNLPKDLIRNAVKVSVQSPNAFQLSVARLEQKIIYSDLELQECSEKFRKLVNCLCYFHCQLVWRGNNQEVLDENYPIFQDCDFEVSLSILKLFAEKYLSEEGEQYPWWALKYMLELQYGNHFSNELSQNFIRDELQNVLSSDSISTKDSCKVDCNILSGAEKFESSDAETSLSMDLAKLILIDAFKFKKVLASLIGIDYQM